MLVQLLVVTPNLLIFASLPFFSGIHAYMGAIPHSILHTLPYGQTCWNQFVMIYSPGTALGTSLVVTSLDLVSRLGYHGEHHLGASENISRSSETLGSLRMRMDSEQPKTYP
jgi:hypothetical protein